MAFSRDGRQLAAGNCDGVVRIWDVTRKENVPRQTEDDALEFAGAVGLIGNRTYITHPTSFGAGLVREFSHGKQIMGIGFSPDGKSVLTASYDKTAKIWNQGKLAQEPTRILAHGAEMFCLASSHDGRRLLSAGADGIAKLWDVRTGREIPLGARSRAHQLFAADISPDEKGVRRNL